MTPRPADGAVATWRWSASTAAGWTTCSGLAVIGRDRQDRTLWRLWARAWAHPIVLKRRKEIAETLKDFSADGDLVFCEEPTQDIREVADVCERLRDAGLLPEQLGIGVDKLGLPAIVDELVERGFGLADEGGMITGISQGGYLNPAIQGMARKLADGTLKHAGQPLMAWCVGNAKVELKGSSRAITKQAAGVAKIDPLIAAFNAAMLMARNPEARPVLSVAAMIVLSSGTNGHDRRHGQRFRPASGWISSFRTAASTGTARASTRTAGICRASGPIRRRSGRMAAIRCSATCRSAAGKTCAPRAENCSAG